MQKRTSMQRSANTVIISRKSEKREIMAVASMVKKLSKRKPLKIIV
jgi:hypothetical protein